MRIRTTLIAAAGAVLFAVGGAGVAQAGVVVDHATGSGAYMIDNQYDCWCGHYTESGEYEFEYTHIELN